MHVYSAPRQRHPEDRSPCCDRKQQQEAVPETAHRPVSPIPFMAGFGLLRGQRLELRSTRKENIRHHWVNSCSAQDAVPFITGDTTAWRRVLRNWVGCCPFDPRIWQSAAYFKSMRRDRNLGGTQPIAAGGRASSPGGHPSERSDVGGESSGGDQRIT